MRIFFNELLEQLTKHLEKKYYHTLTTNIELLISLLKNDSAHQIEVDSKIRFARLVCEILPILDQQESEFFWHNYLHDLAHNINEIFCCDGLRFEPLRELLINKLAGATEDKHVKRQGKFVIWKSVKICRADEFLPSLYYLVAKQSPDLSNLIIINHVLRLIFPYVSVSVKLAQRTDEITQYKRTLYRWLDSYISQILKLSKFLPEVENYWDVIHLYHFLLVKDSSLKQNLDNFPEGYRKTYCDNLLILNHARTEVEVCYQQTEFKKSIFVINDNILQLNNVELLFDIHNIRQRLQNARVELMKHPSIEIQRRFAEVSFAILREFFNVSVSLLGPPPCKVALLSLGSTSRMDRMPYSDVELALLHGDTEEINKLQSKAYCSMLGNLLEMAIIGIGETLCECNPQEGFRIDPSTHFTKEDRLVGTPKQVLAAKVTQEIEKNIYALIDDESLYSLLQPLLINESGEELFKDYKIALQGFLAENITAENWRTLCTRFNISSPQDLLANIRSFSYRKVIALFCLYDVLVESTNDIKIYRNRNGELDIKKAYYKPLTYFALNIRLFHGIDACHPYEILTLAKDCQEKYKITDGLLGFMPSGFLALCLEAINIILRLRVDLHEKARIQREFINNAELPINLRLNLKIIKEGIIQPLIAALKKYLELQQPVQCFANILIPYLEKRHAWYEEYRENGMRNCELLNILAHYPYISETPNLSISPAIYRDYSVFFSNVKAAFGLERSLCKVSATCGLDPNKVYYLDSALVAKIFDANGIPQGDEQYSSPTSKVKLVSIGGKRFFIKFKAIDKCSISLLGRELAVNLLHQILGSQFVALGIPLRLTYHTEVKDLTYWAWISEEIEGGTLEDAMKDAPQILEQIDAESYTQLFLLSMLIYPEDGNPRNFILSPHQTNGNSYRLIAIDNGHVFVNPVRTEGWFCPTDVLDLKTMVYLLKHCMQRPLSRIVVEQWLNLKPEQIYTEWEKAIEDVNKSCRPYLEEGLNVAIPRADYGKYNKLIDLSPEIKEWVKFKLQLIYMKLSDLLNAEELGNTTHRKFLHYIDPSPAFRYDKYLDEDRVKTPEDYYSLQLGAYTVTPNKKRYTTTSPEQVLARSLNIEYVLRTMQFAASDFAAGHFDQLVCNGRPDEGSQKLRLKIIKGIVFTEFLDLSNCQVLTDDDLWDILVKSPQLKELNLTNCLKLTVSAVKYIYRRGDNLERLILSVNIWTDKITKAWLPEKLKHLIVLNYQNRVRPVILFRDSASLLETDNYGRTALLCAAYNGRIEVMQWLLANGATMQEKAKNGATALLFAACTGQIATMQWLLAENRATLQEKDNNGFTALLWAALNGKIEAIEWLLAHGATLQEKVNDGKTALLCAVWNGEIAAMEWLLAHGATMQEKAENGATALLCAACTGQIGAMEWLLAHGATLQEKDKNGRTALLWAACNGQIAAMEWLLAHGVTLQEKAENGATALLCAACTGQIAAMEWLLAHGATMQEKDARGRTALLSAAWQGEIAAMDWLLAHGATMQEKAENGATALLCAACTGKIAAMEWLLAHGATLQEKDNEGKTALLCAACAGKIAAMEWLLDHGAALQESDKDGFTALFYAACNLQIAAMKWLLARGAALEERDASGRTALLWAAWNGKIAAMKWLLAHDATLQEKDNYNNTVLLAAVASGKLSTVRYLIEECKYQDINHSNRFGFTALDSALLRNYSEIVTYLQSLKAISQVNVDATAYPLHYAVIHDYPNIPNFIEDTTILERPDINGNTPLHLAVGFGRCEEVTLLLSKVKGNLNHKNKYGYTPLHLAVIRFSGKDSTVIKLLLQYGADISIADNEGNNVLYLAIFFCKNSGTLIETIEILLQAGIFATQSRSQKEACLELAKRECIPKAAMELLMRYSTSAGSVSPTGVVAVDDIDPVQTPMSLLTAQRIRDGLLLAATANPLPEEAPAVVNELTRK